MQYKQCNGIGEQQPCVYLTKRYHCRKFKCELTYTRIVSKAIGKVLNVEPCQCCKESGKEVIKNNG